MAIKKILISQNKSQTKTPYDELAQKYNLQIDYRKFIKIEGISVREFRKQKIDFSDFTAIIFTSKVSIDNFFNIVQEIKYTIPASFKYFCINEAIALYLQKYTVYRKRKISYANGTYDGLIELLKKNDKEKYILPVAENHTNSFPNKLKRNKINFSKVILYRTVSEDLSDLNINDYDLIAFFSPFGVRSLIENFPDIKDNDKIVLAAYGTETQKEAKKLGLKITVKAPTKTHSSLVSALEAYIKKHNA